MARNMAMMFTVVAKNSLGMREGFSLNQLVFHWNPILTNLMGVLEGYFKSNAKNKSGPYTNGE